MKAAALEKSDQTISSRQFSILAILVCVSVKLFMLPVIMLKAGGRSTVFTLLIFTASDFIILGAVLIISRLAPELTFFKIAETAFGKIISKIIAAAAAVYVFIKVILLLTVTKNYLLSSFNNSLNWNVYLIPLILFMLIFSFGHQRSFARTAELLLPVIIFVLVTVTLLMKGQSKFVRLLPLTGPDAENGTILTGLKSFPYWFGDNLLLAIFLGKIKKSRHFNKAALISSATASVVVIISSLVIYAAYIDVAYLFEYGKKVNAVTQSNVSKLNLGRVDIILFSIWVIGVIIMCGMYFFSLARAGEFIFNKKKNPYSSVIAAVLVFFAAYYLFGDESLLFFCLTEIFSYFSWSMQVLFVVFFTLGAYLIKKKEKLKQKEKPDKKQESGYEKIPQAENC